MKLCYPTGCTKCGAQIPDRKYREHLEGRPLYGDMELHVRCGECGHVNKFKVLVDVVKLFRAASC
ncbi:MAG: hypothetical protein ACYTE8_00955 [Planctomycetota bacterium]